MSAEPTKKFYHFKYVELISKLVELEMIEAEKHVIKAREYLKRLETFERQLNE